MAGEDTTIRIKTTADVSGAVQTEREFDRVSEKAREMGKANADAAAKSTSAINGIQGAIGKVRAALTGFGIVGLVMQVVSAFKAWRDAAKEAEDKVADMGRESAKAANAAHVREMAEAYSALTSAMVARQKAQKDENDLIGEEVRLRREAEAAAVDLEEQKALAAVDPNSGTASEERAAISARFAGRRASAATSNRREDIQLQRQALAESADLAGKTADQLEGTLGADKAAIARARLRYRTNLQLSTMGNAADKDYLSLRFWREGKTDAGDAERERQKKEAAEAKEEVRKLESDLAAKERQIADLRAQAARDAHRREMLGGALATADVSGEASEIRSRIAVDAAGSSLERKREQIDKAAAERARLTASVTSGESQAENLRRQIAFHQRRYGAAVDAQAQAGLAENIARGDKSAADNSGLKAAQEAKYQADRTVAQINGVLGELTAKLKAVEEGLKRDRSRLASAKEDL